MSQKNKKFTVKIYDSSGTTLKRTLSNQDFNSTPNFNSKIDGGFGECVLDLNLPYDDFGEGDTIDYMFIVKIYVIDDIYPKGRLVYTGFISKITPFIDASKQGVSLSVLGLVSLLSLDYYKDGSSYEVTHSNQDPAVIMQAVLDYFNSINGNSLLSYSAETMENVGTNVSYTFKKKKWLDAIQDTFGLAGSGVWWSVDQNGYFYFKPKPSTATHTFTLGKDIEKFENNKSSEDIINAVRVYYDSDLASYVDCEDSTSITKYGRRTKIINDSDITDSTTATQKATQTVEDNKNPKIKGALTINNQYDIESIKVGDTCKVLNLKKGSTQFTSNMQISMVRYYFDSVTLELEDFADFGTTLNKFVNT